MFIVVSKCIRSWGGVETSQECQCVFRGNRPQYIEPAKFNKALLISSYHLQNPIIIQLQVDIIQYKSSLNY